MELNNKRSIYIMAHESKTEQDGFITSMLSSGYTASPFDIASLDMATIKRMMPRSESNFSFFTLVDMTSQNKKKGLDVVN